MKVSKSQERERRQAVAITPMPADGVQVVSEQSFCSPWWRRNGLQEWGRPKDGIRLKAQQELAKIEQQIEQLEAVTRAERRYRAADRRNCTSAWTPCAGRFTPARRLGEDRTGAASAASVHAGLHRAHLHRLERDSRRPRLRRRSCHRLRHGALSRRRGHGRRPQKARDTKQKVYRNFGMPNPEGYRKALRVMKIAEKFGRPIFTFVDTPGAYPGLGAEERGQAEAIARNLREMARLQVPIITTITGEGGSGGALAIAVADRVLMMENAVYSVISPEGCASIMWRDATKKELAAEAMKITAPDLTELGCIDGIVPEPEGGAHTDHEAAAALLDGLCRSILPS